MPEVSVVCTPKTFHPLVNQMLEAIYTTIQDFQAKGVRIKTEDMELTITGTMLTEDGLNKFDDVTIQERTGEEKQVTQVPEVTSTTTSKRHTKNATEGGQTETSTDKGTTTSSEQNREDATDTGSQSQDTSDQNDSNTLQLHATADDITTTSAS
ncbi:MAG: hypothetical protein JWO94_257 [Verrucomicrobiaceae bacterium]|nr:hypothetical protein [Verrucomicrobiaceae bacterium]